MNEETKSRRGSTENLKRGRKKGDSPTRKLSETKVTEFCLYFLTHGESIKSTAGHVNISLTYAYEFFRKSEVQTKLRELRLSMGKKMIDDAVNQLICTRQFIDEHLAQIIANPRPHPKRGFADQIAAARLAAEFAGLTDMSHKQVPIVENIVHTSIQGSDVYVPQVDRQRHGIQDQRSSDIDQRLLS
jgi:hypothetical protein